MEALLILPILLISVVVHEISHGWAALKLGDPTAKQLGRLTLNPIPHIDLFGSILVPLFSYLAAGTVFIAWAKPVPINPTNFRNPRRDDILVSGVGPLSNLLVAFLCAVIYGFSAKLFGTVEGGLVNADITLSTFILKMCLIGITLNIYLAVFNLIPVPPLDGSHILASILPEKMGWYYRRIGFFGIFVIILLMRVDVFRNAIVSIVQVLHVPYAFVIHLLG